MSFDPDLRACFPAPAREGGTVTALPASPAQMDGSLSSRLFVAGSVLRGAGESGGSSLGSRDVPSVRTAGGSSGAPDTDLPEIGAILDKYRIEQLIGTGGFAAVYRATHLMLQMPVAIKLLRPKVIRKRPGLAALLCEEARYAARINHPNVVRVFDVAHSGAITYVVMEFIEGQSLAEAIAAQGALPVASVLRVGRDVASGLKAGLEQGLIHRDVKPANVLLTRSGEAKLVDLGLAHPKGDAHPAPPGGRTKSASIVGTPGYMAPEQAEDPENVDFRADLYALGVTLYHMAVGRPPFPLKEPLQTIVRRQSEPVRPPELIVPGFPGEVSSLILWLLERRPEHRPGSYEIALDAFQKALEALPKSTR